ncbi:hypothetical protein EDB85DRAFT_507355 [Lactarius pseudohatsudake]|nr:hypothetical protein EDB85DRAFT_507355 [Lactarius pseudohatsudake]
MPTRTRTRRWQPSSSLSDTIGHREAPSDSVHPTGPEGRYAEHHLAFSRTPPGSVGADAHISIHRRIGRGTLNLTRTAPAPAEPQWDPKKAVRKQNANARAQPMAGASGAGALRASCTARSAWRGSYSPYRLGCSWSNTQRWRVAPGRSSYTVCCSFASVRASSHCSSREARSRIYSWMTMHLVGQRQTK